MGHPTIYPTGVTLYDPDRSWNGYTIFQAPGLGALLIDMNGREVQLWKGLHGFPSKLLPGGQVFGSTGERNPQHGTQDQIDLVQVDWEGNVVWRFDRLEYIADPGETPRWFARQHHDFQRQGNPVGYHAPGQEPLVDRGSTFLLVHENVQNYAISEHPLLDDKIIEVDWKGNIVWQWRAHEHFEELGFDEEARAALRRDPNLRAPGASALGGAGATAAGIGDWLHINSLSLLGPNRWYDAGDERFHPDNLIWDAREANIIAIVDKKTGRIAWKLGPRYDGSEAERRLGWIIGQHHAHLIPRGLPGEGNLLVFDNGGWAGYGAPNAGAPRGIKTALRDHSRVLEIDPITLEIRWQYTPREAGFVMPLDASRFYSPFISSAQRLPNGNTLITEGSDGRIFEVTPTHEIVWEYISPYWRKPPLSLNLVYRAYRAPYGWVPQLPAPRQTPVPRLDVATFRVPGAAPLGRDRVVELRDAQGYAADGDFCVATADESEATRKPG
ncbi:aryl-sulfate sulfotransferase [Sorangium sp. So ce388]|uniref:aryl-sulfate sulfotransferase n=1 Tax=Sorangium sp. So ce388 TaxID=3133309 RepID=UPI003F5C820A